MKFHDHFGEGNELRRKCSGGPGDVAPTPGTILSGLGCMGYRAHEGSGLRAHLFNFIAERTDGMFLWGAAGKKWVV